MPDGPRCDRFAAQPIFVGFVPASHRYRKESMMGTSAYVAFEKGWEVRPCVNHLGHVTSLDIGPPVEPGARGGSVIASVYSGQAVANLLSAAPELLESLENAVDALAGFKISPIGGLDKMRRDILKARGANASVDTRPEGGDSTKIEAPFTGGAVPEGQTPDA